MDKKIKERFTNKILQTAFERFNIEPVEAHQLDGFENFLYEYRRNGKSFILRISHSLRRSVELIQGEADWINHLAAGGATVARAIHSASKQLVEAIPDGLDGTFLATSFLKAPGRAPKNEDWTPDFCENYGWLLGRIHVLSQVYQPPSGGHRPQ